MSFSLPAATVLPLFGARHPAEYVADLSDPKAGIAAEDFRYSDLFAIEFWARCASVVAVGDVIRVLGPKRVCDVRLEVAAVLPGGLRMRLLEQRPEDGMLPARPEVVLTATEDLDVDDARNLTLIGRELYRLADRLPPGQKIELHAFDLGWFAKGFVTARDDDNEIIRFRWLTLQEFGKPAEEPPLCWTNEGERAKPSAHTPCRSVLSGVASK
jgi:hypothetical protein